MHNARRKRKGQCNTSKLHNQLSAWLDRRPVAPLPLSPNGLSDHCRKQHGSGNQHGRTKMDRAKDNERVGQVSPL